ncbi:RimJ/RimL family protein N-acetyltransferase [Silvimonas terrae]|uniref:RimJ/RimL family protein N-acetyltransferase n=1 Tax=Silvimonas terrae TaxID=300266 RepID=A0A840RJ20_9NEIS|nr:GNAT family protein [Silvimonas terrae]MBB5192306.1 RimJ/RimL family protein N-acetyltransferase [Silvimonas terrae]
MRILTPPDLPIAGLALRQLEERDLPVWYDYLRLPAVIEHTSWNLHSAEDLIPLWQAYVSEGVTTPRRLALVDGTDTLVGTIGFHTVNDMNRSAELAYDLAPAYWGHGLAAQVGRAVVPWAFEQFGWLRIQATAMESNLRSARVLEKAGFQFEGLLRSYRVVRGQPRHFRLFARLASDVAP